MNSRSASSLLALCVVVFAHIAVGQGYVDFRNGGITFPTPADRLVYAGFVGGTKLVGTNFVAGLWYVKGTDPCLLNDLHAGNQAGTVFTFRTPTTSLPGTWLATAPANQFALPDIGVGDTAILQVRVWDVTLHPTFADAFASGSWEASTPFTFTMPDPRLSQPNAFYMDNLRAFGASFVPATCVPEPGTIALGLVGTVLLGARLRRR